MTLPVTSTTPIPTEQPPETQFEDPTKQYGDFLDAGGDVGRLMGGGYRADRYDPEALALSRLSPERRQAVLTSAGYDAEAARQRSEEIDNIFGLRRYPVRPSVMTAFRAPGEFVKGFGQEIAAAITPTANVYGFNPEVTAGGQAGRAGAITGGFFSPPPPDMSTAQAALQLSLLALGAPGVDVGAAFRAPAQVVRLTRDGLEAAAQDLRTFGLGEDVYGQIEHAAGQPLRAGGAGPQVIYPTEAAAKAGMPAIKLELTPGERAGNWLRDSLENMTTIKTTRDNPATQAVLRADKQLNEALQSRAVVLSEAAGSRARDLFEFEKNGQIQALKGVEGFDRAPTLVDVVRRYPLFESRLSKEQQDFLQGLRRSIEPLEPAWREVRPDLGKAPDVMDGGFYLPRGGAEDENFEPIEKIYAGRAGPGKPSAAKPTVFGSQAEGIERGYHYDPFDVALRRYIVNSGKEIINNHLQNVLKEAVTPEDILMGSRVIRKAGEPLLKSAAMRLPDIEAKGVSPGQATLVAERTPLGEHALGFPGLQAYSAPDAVANAMNKILRSQNPATGGPWSMSTLAAANGLLRGLRATADLSATGVQTLMGIASDPQAWLQAQQTVFRSLLDRDAFGMMLNDFDRTAVAQDRLTAQTWARVGTRVGGVDQELTLGGTPGLSQRLSRLPLIREANRAYGVATDVLRLQWNDDLLAEQMGRTGKSAEQLVVDGTAEHIARITNRATGYSLNKTGGDLGDLVLFAPRFFQSKMELAASALKAPGDIEGMVARRAILRTSGSAAIITMLANAAQGKPTDFHPIVNGKWNSNFMRIDYGDRKWSLLGPYDSFVGMLVNAGAAAATGKPGTFPTRQIFSSPLAAAAWDAFTNKTFEGQLVRDSPQHLARYIGESLLPFSYGNLLVGDTRSRIAGADPSGFVNLVGDVLGLKGTPLSVTNKLDSYVRSLHVDAKGVPMATSARPEVHYWRDLEPVPAGRLYQRPEVKAIYQTGEREASPRVEAKLRDDAYQAALVTDGLLIRGPGQGGINGLAWQDALRRSETASAARRQALEAAGIAKTRAGGDANKQALSDYYALAKNYQQGNAFDFEGYDEARQSFLAGLPAEQAQYIQDNLHPNATPIQEKFFQLQGMLRAAGRDWAKVYPQIYDGLPGGAKAVFNEYQARRAKFSPTELSQWLRGQPPAAQETVREMNVRVKMARQYYRAAHPGFDRLYRLFYDVKPLPPSG